MHESEAILTSQHSHIVFVHNFIVIWTKKLIIHYSIMDWKLPTETLLVINVNK